MHCSVAKKMHWVLFSFNKMPLKLKYCLALSRIISALLFKVSSSLMSPVKSIWESSIYWTRRPSFMYWGKSFSYIRKSKEPQIEPWGTPRLTLFGDDKIDPIRTDCTRFLRLSSNQKESMFNVQHLSKRIWWLPLSKALEKSSKRSRDIFFCSIFSYILFVMVSNAVSVDKCSLKPCCFLY